MSTIKDVAALANVSVSTVSRALSGKVPVEESTRQRVMDAVEKLNYSPNVLAKGLKNGKTNIIALIIPDISNMIYPAVARGVEAEAKKHGYRVILCNTDEDERTEAEYIKQLREQSIDGFIIASAARNPKRIVEADKAGVPVILLFRELDCEVDQVLVENEKGAYEATKYLLERGCKKIAVVNGRQEIVLYKDRYKGYLRALKEAGISADESLTINLTIENEESGFNAVSSMLNNGIKPDAVFCTSDPIAWGAVRAAVNYGLNIPEDLSIIGFDNLEMSRVMQPSLTTVSQPYYKMGVLASAQLIEKIENKNHKKSKIFRMNTKLVIRETTI